MPADPESPTPLNHVFVDFENVHQIDLSMIGAKSVVFTLFVGAKQTKLDTTLVEALMTHAASVQLVRINTTGKNALDFVLAYHVGRAAIQSPSAHFHIVSKDKDYDALVTYLRSRQLHAHRHDSFADLTFSAKPKAPVAKSVPAGADDPLSLAVSRLRKNDTNRPKKKATLLRHLKSGLGKDATDEDAAKLLERLSKAGHLSIDEKGVVSYRV